MFGIIYFFLKMGINQFVEDIKNKINVIIFSVLQLVNLVSHFVLFMYHHVFYFSVMI